MQMMPKQVFWPVIDCSSWYAIRVTLGKSVVLRVVTSGHVTKMAVTPFRSAIAEKPMLHTNFTALSSTEPELLPTKVLHCENREFRGFCEKKIVGNIKFSVRTGKVSRRCRNTFAQLYRRTRYANATRVTRG